MRAILAGALLCVLGGAQSIPAAEIARLARPAVTLAGTEAAVTAARPAGKTAMSSVEIAAICGRHDLAKVTDGPRECAAHCAKLHYTREYDYTSYDDCYRCCFSGAECIPPEDGAAACTGNGRCDTAKAIPGRGAKGTCVCDEDWTGAFCERRSNSCPRFGAARLACAGNGECKDSKCVCKAGFSGDACEKKTCPTGRGGKECSGQRCNTLTGKCMCGSLWKLRDCSVAACPVAANGKECNGHGKCGDDHRCDCARTGYFGDACHKKECPKDSSGATCGGSHFGHCDTNGSGKCHCRPGFKGPSCTGVECALVNGKPCGGAERGICAEETGQCKCKRALWAGPNCERPACPRPAADDEECGGNGECVTAVDRITRRKRSTCKCDEAHTGDACERTKCPADAHGNECSARAGQGTCNGKTGTCTCAAGFDGPSCELKKCWTDPEGRVCSGNGQCNGKTGECECGKMYKGHRCHVKACAGYSHAKPKNECSGQGECNNGGCICAAAWKGEACNVRSCPADNGIECNLQGDCDGKTGKCKCNNKWRGASCHDKICLFSKINGKECGGNGRCVEGICKCAAGWRDHACDNKICPFANKLECNGRGSCRNGACKCQIQYRGDACATYYQARFSSSGSLANYEKTHTTRKAYKGARRNVDFGSRVTVVKGDTYEALLSCNLAGIHPSGQGQVLNAGRLYMRMNTKGPVTHLARPSLGVAANMGYWQPVTSLGLFRATADGEVTIGGEYWSENPAIAVTYVYCSLGAFRALSGKAALVTSTFLPTTGGPADLLLAEGGGDDNDNNNNDDDIERSAADALRAVETIVDTDGTPVVASADASADALVGTEDMVQDGTTAVSAAAAATANLGMMSPAATSEETSLLGVEAKGAVAGFPAKSGLHYLTGSSLRLSLELPPGGVAHVLLTCALSNAGGGTSYMRSVPTSGHTALLGGNWITSTVARGADAGPEDANPLGIAVGTSAPAGKWGAKTDAGYGLYGAHGVHGIGGWNQGVSQAVYKRGPGQPATLVVEGSYHTGQGVARYAGCAILGTVVNGTYGYASSDPGYSKTWTTRRLPGTKQSGLTDFSATVAVTKGDFVRGLVTANLLQPNEHTSYMKAVRTGGSAKVKIHTEGNWITTSSKGEWHGGVSQVVFEVIEDGDLTVGGSYHTGGNLVTYVYGNAYAEVLGPTAGRA
jgi:hypothetical protein